MKKDILAVRISARERRLLDETQKRLKVSRSEVVREAIIRYAAQTEREYITTVAERLGPLLGSIKGADHDLSSDTGRKYRAFLIKKHGQRSR